ncbi:MAG: septal ring lytic transglycosylase RlpA family protein [Spirochaetota bacterium]|nr:septal ring lytic transglycosylase RlpA family protein [Spirochaetota bacterium]
MRYMIRFITFFWLISIFITSCTPSRSVVRDRGVNQRGIGQVSAEGDDVRHYRYEDEGRYEQVSLKRGSRYDRGNIIKEEDNANIYNKLEGDDDYNNDRNDSLSQKRFYQKGLASWYGRRFHGKITASGERFNMHRLTAAHKTLPFGTAILVKNFDNGKEVKVVVNDRGPYRDGRIIDLSYAAAKEINMITDGETEVGIKIVRNSNYNRYGSRSSGRDEIELVAGDSRRSIYGEENNFSDDLSSNRYSIQTGAFYSRRNAEKLKRRLEIMFDNPIRLVHEDDMYKVRIGGINSSIDVKRYKQRLVDEDIPCFVHFNNELISQ